MWEIISFLPVSIENFEIHFMAKHFQNVYTEFDNEPLCVDNEYLKFHQSINHVPTHFYMELKPFLGPIV